MCDKIVEKYYRQTLLARTEEQNKNFETLISDYNTAIEQFEGNPKALARLAAATLGIEPNEPNTAFPRAAADKLAVARRALIKEPEQTTTQPDIPPWLCLACQWPRRHILFISGSILVLISFVFFGPLKSPPHTMEVKSNTPESSK